MVRGPSAAQAGACGGHGRRLGSWAARIKLTVGSLAPSASAQEAADQPKPNRYDHDINEQRCLRHISWVLLGCQRMSPIRPRPRTYWPVNELLADERDGEAMLQPLIGRASWNAARQKQRTEHEDGSQRPQHDEALHCSTLRPTERSYEPRLSSKGRLRARPTRANLAQAVRRWSPARAMGGVRPPSPRASLASAPQEGAAERSNRMSGYSSSNRSWRSHRGEMGMVPSSRKVRAAWRASSSGTRCRCGVGVSWPPSRRGCQPRSDGSPIMS